MMSEAVMYMYSIMCTTTIEYTKVCEALQKSDKEYFTPKEILELVNGWDPSTIGAWEPKNNFRWL